MNPKLSDDTVAGLPLSLGRAELLEEIMSTPVLDDRPAPTVRDERRRRGWLVPAAAAAVVAALAAGTAWWASGSGPTSAAPSQSATQTSPTKDYRAILDAPGWTVDNVYTDSRGGELSYAKGEQYVEISWYPADTHDDYVEDRRHITEPPSDGQAIEVLGLGAQMWAYSGSDHTAIRDPQAGFWIEVRGGGMDEASYLDLLGRLRLVDQREFEAAMPASYVDGSERDAAVQEILDGIGEYVDPLIPPGSQRVGFSSNQNDPYHLGADVAGAVACEWLGEFVAAQEAGDQQRMDKAAAVLATSRRWPVLQEMTARGEYSQGVWELADRAAAGEVPEDYAGWLGCEG